MESHGKKWGCRLTWGMMLGKGGGYFGVLECMSMAEKGQGLLFDRWL